MEMLPARQK